MTVAEGIASILLWSVNLGLVCVLISWCRRKYRVDLLRYRLFVRRDELFDLALDGSLGFGDQAYVLLRRKINNMLRFSHKISFVWVVLVSYLCRGPAFDKVLVARDREWKHAVSALRSEEARNRVLSLHDNVSIEVTKHTVGWFAWICIVTWSRLLMTQRQKNEKVATSALEEELLRSMTVKRIPKLVEMNPNPESQWARKANVEPVELV